MGDYLLDLRPKAERALARAATRLRFVDETRTEVLDEARVGVVATYVGEAALWAPYRAADGSFVVVAGRVAFDEAEWSRAEREPIGGDGGLAAKAVYLRYRRSGTDGLEGISGNCAVVVYDAPGRRCHLVTDCAGVFPTYTVTSPAGRLYGSHPDVVAEAGNETHRLDEVSLAEFVIASTVTPPYTYYERVRFVEAATRWTFALGEDGPGVPERKPFFAFSYRGDPKVPESELAEQLAAAIRGSVRRRTLSRLGTSVVALSGGLDSRALLACVEDPSTCFAFCLYDAPNRELRVAEEVADALGVRFVPIRRGFDYYADHAEQGVRISGGMGSFANNHFLGVLGRLHAEGMRNLLTGCYCDYLFKGLPLNLRKHWLSGRETLGPFRHEFYFDHHVPSTDLAGRVRGRWTARIPEALRAQDSVAAVFEIEARRSFPLCYEGDNQQRVVPQRASGWSLPVAEREILELYCRIPYTAKLDRALFLRALSRLDDERLRSIPDANTGVRPGASAALRQVSSTWLRVKRKLRNLKPSVVSDGSWPDWGYYLTHSPKVADLWRRPNAAAMDFFRRVMGREAISESPTDYQGGRVFLLASLLTAKLWFDQR